MKKLKKKTASPQSEPQLLFWIPFLLAIANALFWYFPSPNRLMGWGDDPYFNLWVYEHNWDHFAHSGPLAFLGKAFWESNIFYPHPMTIALSENYAYSSLLAWPLHAMLGDGFQAMSLLCLISSIAAFFFTAKWLQSLGLRRHAWWGGLLFASCGWVQTQSAHFQNTAIFLFPLALWMWNRFVEKPSSARLLACAGAFGWIIGWNLYFQTFANALIFLLVGWTALKRREMRWKLALLLAATVIIEFPIAHRYMQLQSIMGNYSVGSDEYRFFAARLKSFFFHMRHKNLIQYFFPHFYPLITDSPGGNIEWVGFIGYAWLTLWVGSFFSDRISRFWAFAALAAWLISLGPDYHLHDLFVFFPGASSLRSIGRAQVLSALFSIPAILIFIEKFSKNPWQARVALGMVLLELAPGRLRDTVSLAPDLFASPSLAQKITAEKSPSLLVFPSTPPNLQLSLSKVPIALYSGYSGRTPVESGLIQRAENEVKSPSDLSKVLEFSQASLVASLASDWNERLAQAPELDALGCDSLEGRRFCLFRVKAEVRQRYGALPRIRLDRDTLWRYSSAPGRHSGSLYAAQHGFLDVQTLAYCHLQEFLKFPFLPALSSGKRLEDWYFRGTEFPANGLIFDRVSTQAIFKLPPAIRPNKSYEIVCRYP